MMLKPIKLYDQDAVTAIGVQNPFYFRKAKKAQPALYDGDELLKTHHVPIIITSSEEDLKLAETTRIKMNEKMNEKMNDSVCVEKRVKIIPLDYSKENFMATFTPQTQLTPEQVFWSNEIKEKKAEDLKARTSTLHVLPLAIMYLPNTPVHLVPRTLRTNSQVNIENFAKVQKSLVKEVRAMKVVFENLEAEVDQNAIALKSGEIEWKNLHITNETLIANCIAQDVLYTATDSVMNASRFHKLSTAYNVVINRVIDLEAENSKLLEKIQNDDNNTMDVPEFDAFFELDKRDDQIQALQEQLEHFKAENEKVKQHYKELFNSIKITCVKTIERTTSLQTEIENLKTQLKGKMPCVTSNVESPKVSIFEKYAIEVESIPPSQRNNRDVHHHYLNRLRDTLDTLRKIVEEARSK
ncbi:hypothetical protein Tco_0950507 [Tanacetum coccineum]